jgi:hypothetical protein
MAFFSFHFQGPSAVPVINGPSFGSRDQTALDNVFGNFDGIVPDPGPGGRHHLFDPGVPAFESDFFNNIKCGLFDFPDLVIGQDPHAHGPGSGGGGLNHARSFQKIGFQLKK